MYKAKQVAGILVAAGTSSRMGFDKLFYRVEGTEVLRRALHALDSHPYIDSLVVVVGDNLPKVSALLQACPPAKPLQIVAGGATRTESVAAGVRAAQGAGLVAIHDAARPYVDEATISRAVEAAERTGAAAPAVAVKDTIKLEQGGLVAQTPPRQSLRAVQTPQVFGRALFTEALARLPKAEYPLMTDDCMVVERLGLPVELVEGSYQNIKITTPDDLPKGDRDMRIGHGYDVHKLVAGRPLILGGVEVAFEQGLLGHSDADVLLHAVADALLGAAALGDIGRHFPDTDPAYKGADSLVLLRRVGEILQDKGFAVCNVDATLLCQRPKIAPYIDAMRQNIAGALAIPLQNVSVKATTEEGLGFTGAGEGMAAHCVALIQ